MVKLFGTSCRRVLQGDLETSSGDGERGRKETYRPKKREKETSRDRSLLDAVTTSDPEQRKSYAHLQIHLQYIEIKTCLL